MMTGRPVDSAQDLSYRLTDMRDPAGQTHMGAPARVNKQLSERYQARLAAEPGATAQRRTELWIEPRAETPNVGAQYFDSMFSVDKTITLVQGTATANAVQAQLDGDLDAARSGKPARPASGSRSSSPCAYIPHVQQECG
jgi:hypothetical protein